MSIERTLPLIIVSRADVDCRGARLCARNASALLNDHNQWTYPRECPPLWHRIGVCILYVRSSWNDGCRPAARGGPITSVSHPLTGRAGSTAYRNPPRCLPGMTVVARPGAQASHDRQGYGSIIPTPASDDGCGGSMRQVVPLLNDLNIEMTIATLAYKYGNRLFAICHKR